MVLISSCHNSAPEKASAPFPNIVYILADDMGYGDISCLNPDSLVRTPHIDQLAAEGMIFTDAHAGASVCTPTRYGILTGRYCWRSRLKKAVLWAWDGPLIGPGRMTVGDLLHRHGYSTACIGKWHLGWEWPARDGSHITDVVKEGSLSIPERIAFGEKVDFRKKIGGGPTTRGFDYYFGDDVPNFPPYCFIENDHTVGYPDRVKPDSMFGMKGPMLTGWKLEAVMPAITGKAVEYIRAKGGRGAFGKRPDAPFFLYFALTAPHTPIAPAQEFRGKSRAGSYGDYVQEVDWTVGQVLQALQESGQAENTLIILTSDNGSPGRDGTGMCGALNSVLKYGHHPGYIFRGIKSDIWEGGHHIPFIARWPGHIPAGSRSDEVICLTDLMATCAAIVGDTLPDNAGGDSYNLLPVLTGKPYKKPLREATVHHSIDGSFSLRQGKWKLEMCAGSGGWSHPRSAEAKKEGLPSVQLYDLSTDIGEQKNVSTEHPALVDSMRRLLEKYILEGRSTPGRPRLYVKPKHWPGLEWMEEE